MAVVLACTYQQVSFQSWLNLHLLTKYSYLLEQVQLPVAFAGTKLSWRVLFFSMSKITLVVRVRLKFDRQKVADAVRNASRVVPTFVVSPHTIDVPLSKEAEASTVGVKVKLAMVISEIGKSMT